MNSFLTELVRRKVWLFGGIYLALGWVVLQVAIALEGALELPAWVDQVTVIFLALGFPVAMILAWAQESQRTGADEMLSPGETAAGEEPGTAEPILPRSVCVLPLNNMSDERELDWVADGLAEDITTRLSTIGPLNVAARNSAFAFKGKSPDIREVGEALKVSYVVEGSLRIVEETIRVTAQLIDTRTGDHVWAKSYDHLKTDLGGMQSEIVDAISIQAWLVIKERELVRIKATPVEEMDPHETVIYIDEIGNSFAGLDKVVTASEVLEAATRRFPDSPDVYSALAKRLAWQSITGPVDHEALKKQAEEAARKALDLTSSSDPNALQAMGWVLRLVERHDEALIYVRRAWEADPLKGGVWYAAELISHGRFEEALEILYEILVRVGGLNERRATVLMQIGCCHLGLRNFAKAEEVLREAHTLLPNLDTYRYLSIALGYQNKTEEAARELNKYLALPGHYGYETSAGWWSRYYADRTFVEMLIEGLRLAGMAELEEGYTSD